MMTLAFLRMIFAGGVIGVAGTAPACAFAEIIDAGAACGGSHAGKKMPACDSLVRHDGRLRYPGSVVFARSLPLLYH